MTATTTAGTNCSGLGGNIATNTAYFACPASSTYRTLGSTGWIPINFANISAGVPFSNLPVDPVNTSSSNLYYSYQTDGSTFKVTAIPESQKYLASAGANPTMFTSGSNTNLGGGSWVPVPGNPTFGTQNFYVMQYAASCSDGHGNALDDYDTGYQTYSDTSKHCVAANGGRQIAALAGGVPLAKVKQSGDASHYDAASYCTAIGAHLMTNNEWQTIAWNAEGVASNWSGAAVGSGTMPRGNSDASYAEPSGGNPEGYQSGSTSTYRTDFLHQRTLTLSNGSVIWDMAGNVWQWTNDQIIGQNEPHGTAIGWNWYQYNDAGMTYGSLTAAQVAASTPSWMSTQGVGELYSVNTSTLATPYGFVRGGDWNCGGIAGVEALNLNYGPANTVFYIGFRCAR